MKNILNSDKMHVVLCGKTNSGKSTIFNLVINNNKSIISNIDGTTTDPIFQNIEITGKGPIRLVDTAGLLDNTLLGNKREEKTINEILKADLCLCIIDISSKTLDLDVESLKNKFKKLNINPIYLFNKIDLITKDELNKVIEKYNYFIILDRDKSIKKDKIISIIKDNYKENKSDNILNNIVNKHSDLLLVTCSDLSSPKDKLIMPQIKVIKDALDISCNIHICDINNLERIFNNIKKIDLIITDSQLFDKVNEINNDKYLLTSFSILFSNYKGDINLFINSIKKLENLKNIENPNVLMVESCTHSLSHDDIGRVKIPNLLKNKINSNINFIFSKNLDIIFNKHIDLIVHCGGCMLTRNEMIKRLEMVKETKIPIINYGMILAYFSNVLDKSIEFMNKK